MARGDAGLFDPRDHARLRRGAAERRREEFTDSLGPRDVVAEAIVSEVAKGKGVETPDGRPAVYLDTTRIPISDAERSLPLHAAALPSGGIDPLAEPLLTYPVLHYQNGGLVIDPAAQTRSADCSPAVRSPVAHTDATA